MAWTTPKTWNDGDVLTAAELNEQVRDNLDFLFAKPGDQYTLDEAANYNTTSATFVDIDATNLALTITTGGGDVLIWFSGFIYATAVTSVSFDILINGTSPVGDDGVHTCWVTVDTAGPFGSGAYGNFGFTYLATGLSAGSNTFKLQWKTYYSGRSTTLYAGAGSAIDDHPQFGVKEL